MGCGGSPGDVDAHTAGREWGSIHKWCSHEIGGYKVAVFFLFKYMKILLVYWCSFAM